MTQPAKGKQRKPKFRVGQVVARIEYLGSGDDKTYVRLKEWNACGPTWTTDQGTMILEFLLRKQNKEERGQ
jgi:hypothetical protein